MSKAENTTSMADELFFEADEKIRNGKIVEARDLLINLIEQFPEYGRAYNHLGWIYETKYKNYATAENFYKKALEFAPDYPAIYLNYAIVLSSLEKFDELERLLHQALTVPGIAKDKIYNEFAIMYELKGEFLKAIDFYKKAITTSLVEKDIEIYIESINRCKTKKEVLF